MNRYRTTIKILLILCVTLFGAPIIYAQKTYNAITIMKERVPLIWNPYYVVEWNGKYLREHYKNPIDKTNAINRLKTKYPAIAFHVFERNSPAIYMILGTNGQKVPSNTLEALVKEPEIISLYQTVQFYHERAPLTYFAPSITVVFNFNDIDKGKTYLKNFDLKQEYEQGQIFLYRLSKAIIDANHPDLVDKISASKYVDLVAPGYYSKAEPEGEVYDLMED